jgi:hypothetical protein
MSPVQGFLFVFQHPCFKDEADRNRYYCPDVMYVMYKRINDIKLKADFDISDCSLQYDKLQSEKANLAYPQFFYL